MIVTNFLLVTFVVFLSNALTTTLSRQSAKVFVKGPRGLDKFCITDFIKVTYLIVTKLFVSDVRCLLFKHIMSVCERSTLF